MTCTTISPPPHTQHDTSLEHSTRPYPATSHTTYAISPTHILQLIPTPSYRTRILNILPLTCWTPFVTSHAQRTGNHATSPPYIDTSTSKSNRISYNTTNTQTPIDNPNHASPSPTQTTGPISLQTLLPNTHHISIFSAQHQTITSDIHSTIHLSFYTMAFTP